MATRSRNCKGRPPGGEPKTGGKVQKGHGKGLKQVLDESEKKRKSIHTVKIKQEVLEENETNTERTTQVEDKTTSIEIIDDSSDNEVSNAGTKQDKHPTNSIENRENKKNTASTYSKSTKRRLISSKFPKRKKLYYQDIREYAKVLGTKDITAEAVETNAQAESKQISPYETVQEKKIKDLINNITLFWIEEIVPLRER